MVPSFIVGQRAGCDVVEQRSALQGALKASLALPWMKTEKRIIVDNG